MMSQTSIMLFEGWEFVHIILFKWEIYLKTTARSTHKNVEDTDFTVEQLFGTLSRVIVHLHLSILYGAVQNGHLHHSDAGFPSVGCEYVLLPLVNKEAALVCARTKYSQGGKNI